MCSKEIAEVMVMLRQYMERVGTLEVQMEEQKQEIHRQRMERIKFELQSNMTHYKHERRIETLEKQLQELEPERRVQKRQATLLPWNSAAVELCFTIWLCELCPAIWFYDLYFTIWFHPGSVAIEAAHASVIWTSTGTSK